jgi:hypothetical protein
MKEPVSASKYVTLGMRVWALARPTGNNVDEYWQVVLDTLADLESCGFAHTREVANALAKRKIGWHGDRIITPQSAGELQHTVQALRNSLDAEAVPRMTIDIDTNGVPPGLRALSAWPLSDAQRLLLDETIRCIECGAYRSAVVMGWNLAYDYIRRWTYINRLADFNVSLVANHTVKSTGAPKFEPIDTYEDFFAKSAPSEGTVLQTMKGANIIGGEVYDHLTQHLRYRNNYAHPNFKSLTRTQANARVEDLVAIISDSPFN